MSFVAVSAEKYMIIIMFIYSEAVINIMIYTVWINKFSPFLVSFEIPFIIVHFSYEALLKCPSRVVYERFVSVNK